MLIQKEYTRREIEKARLVSLVKWTIRSFERSSRPIHLSYEAKRMLLGYAKEHSDVMLAEIRTRKGGSERFMRGLVQVLAYAAFGEKGLAINPRRFFAFTFPSIGERLEPDLPRNKRSISAARVRTAMKKKCQTFPWC